MNEKLSETTIYNADTLVGEKVPARRNDAEVDNGRERIFFFYFIALKLVT